MTTVYCFTGYPASGKSTACDIARASETPVFSMGEVVRRYATASLDGDITSNAIGAWATSHREQNGNAVFARYTADIVQSSDPAVAVIDGLRTTEELRVFRKRFTEVVVVYVEASFETRLSRIKTRGRDDEASFDAASLRQRDEREAEWGVEDLIAQDHHDTTLQNEGSYESFVDAVLNILTR